MPGFSSLMCSQVKPMRSSAPGPKFSTSTSDSLISLVRISLPSGVLVSSVSERLLLLSMVKYRASTPGMSRNCERVTSPAPGRSTLITSAPNQASNWVQAGPAWTWVKSMILMPSSGLLMMSVSFVQSILRAPPAASWAPAVVRVAGCSLLCVALRIQIGQAAALGAGGLVDHGIDQGGLAGRDCLG